LPDKTKTAGGGFLIKNNPKDLTLGLFFYFYPPRKMVETKKPAG